MPSTILGKKVDETKWEAAKSQAEKEGKGDNYAYIMSIYKTMAHLGKAYDPEQLKMGIKIEMEHTDDPEEAEKIAKDHLDEKADYYTDPPTAKEFKEEAKKSMEPRLVVLVKAKYLSRKRVGRKWRYGYKTPTQKQADKYRKYKQGKGPAAFSPEIVEEEKAKRRLPPLKASGFSSVEGFIEAAKRKYGEEEWSEYLTRGELASYNKLARKSLEPSLVVLTKAKAAPIGETRNRKRGQWRKTIHGWHRISQRNTTLQSVGIKPRAYHQSMLGPTGRQEGDYSPSTPLEMQIYDLKNELTGLNQSIRQRLGSLRESWGDPEEWPSDAKARLDKDMAAANKLYDKYVKLMKKQMKVMGIEVKGS